MARIIGVISGKGGSGKTTTSVNIAASLAEAGHDVIILDGNVTTPNLSLHLGIPFYPVTLHDVLKGKMPVDSAIYNHKSGLKVVPASLASGAMKDVKFERFRSILLNLLGMADILVVDAAAGLGREAQATLTAADELLIVTNPELPAVTDALKTIKMAQENEVRVSGVVLNRVRGHKHEMSKKEVEHMLEVPVVAVIPEDIAVQQSIANKTPVVNHKPKSPAAREFRRLAKFLADGKLDEEPERPRGWFQSLFGWLG